MDAVDAVIEQWRTERPDLPPTGLAAMATMARLGRIATHFTKAVEAVTLAEGLSLGEADVLWCLRRAGDPFTLTPTGLARSLLLSPAGVTNRIDRLVDAGYVERELDPDDRRSFKVRLTAAGRTWADTVVAAHVANEASLLEPLSPSARDAFDRALRTLVASLP